LKQLIEKLKKDQLFGI